MGIQCRTQFSPLLFLLLFALSAVPLYFTSNSFLHVLPPLFIPFPFLHLLPPPHHATGTLLMRLSSCHISALSVCNIGRTGRTTDPMMLIPLALHHRGKSWNEQIKYLKSRIPYRMLEKYGDVKPPKAGQRTASTLAGIPALETASHWVLPLKNEIS